MSDHALAAVVIMLVVAPISVVLLVALLRGYTITIVLERLRRHKGDDS